MCHDWKVSYIISSVGFTKRLSLFLFLASFERTIQSFQVYFCNDPKSCRLFEFVGCTIDAAVTFLGLNIVQIGAHGTTSISFNDGFRTICCRAVSRIPLQREHQSHGIRIELYVSSMSKKQTFFSKFRSAGFRGMNSPIPVSSYCTLELSYSIHADILSIRESDSSSPHWSTNNIGFEEIHLQ